MHSFLTDTDTRKQPSKLAQICHPKNAAIITRLGMIASRLRRPQVFGENTRFAPNTEIGPGVTRGASNVPAGLARTQ